MTLHAVVNPSGAIPAPPKSAMSKWAKPEVKSASRMFGYCLTLDTQDGWWGLVPVLQARLSLHQRVCLAFMALKSIDPENAAKTSDAVLGRSEGMGMPGVPFDSIIDEAAFWTSGAEPKELEAYCLACFTAMSAHRQMAFLEYVQGRAAA